MSSFARRPGRSAEERTRDHTELRGGPARAANGALESRLRFLASFAAGIAAVVLFAWASQASQDEAIRRNEKNVAVLATRLDAICEKLDEIRALLSGQR